MLGQRLFALVVATASGLLATSSADAALYWTAWVSEEGGSPARYCNEWNESAVGWGCSGSYCDNQRLLCETMPFGTTLDPATDKYTSWFSEESDGYITVVFDGGYWYNSFDENFQICQYFGDGHGWPGLAAGVRCSGSYCDSVSLECVQPVKHKASGTVKVAANNCAWTANSYSEEQGSVDFGWNRYIVGAQCLGSYCDNKKFYVCSLTDPGN